MLKYIFWSQSIRGVNDELIKEKLGFGVVEDIVCKIDMRRIERDY